ncbi:TIGR04255 family protein [Bradyrhizobium guangxiense]
MLATSSRLPPLGTLGGRTSRSLTTKLLNWFLECYAPSEFSRIGLRYRDVISRSRLELRNVPWTELLRPHLLGALAMSGLGPDELIGSRNSFALRLGENVKVQVNHGLVASEGDFDYLIDSDFFVDHPTKATIDAAAGALESFRPSTNNLFQWCITKRLFDAMGPKDVSQV